MAVMKQVVVNVPGYLPAFVYRCTDVKIAGAQPASGLTPAVAGVGILILTGASRQVAGGGWVACGDVWVMDGLLEVTTVNV